MSYAAGGISGAANSTYFLTINNLGVIGGYVDDDGGMGIVCKTRKPTPANATIAACDYVPWTQP